MRKIPLQRGYLIIHTIVYGAIALILITGLANWGSVNIRAGRDAALREQAFQIAEAGIEYYRWHLAHASTDYQDGAGAPGPYVHEYRDATGAVIGTFTLTITPPPVGSTLVIVVSEGVVTANPSITRRIEAKFAIPSIAKFAFVANSKMRFGAGTEVFGPIHSNDGIRFDGLAHNLVTSFKYSYDDPDHSGADEYGVHTHLSPSDPVPPVPPPPGTPPSRTDVFISGRQVSVPAVDWNGFTQDLSQMKTDAQTSGRYFAGSGALGYNIVLKTDDTFDLYTVTSLVSPQSNCYNSQNQSGWGTWSIASETLLGNYAFPANGLVFLEDNVWVEGTISSARLTIAAGRFPESSSTNANIIVNEDIRYTNYDGADVLGLIAQGNINVGLVSNDVLTIDAAIVAKNGRAGRYYYRYAFSKSCSPYHQRDTINLFGMIATKERYGFAYTDGNGYETRNIIYDGNLLYGPPPSFPLTSDQYQTISWREL
ncbi:MAG TPA: hypothetical protein DCZ84_01490 [Candidatus Vogelbacteria bacterium]|uniref:Uncharacterized protein n=1 Tax=Candidatus Vogelbacteria bacterium RIFOXYD1_FULL_51_18 TaxID=1802440 RepID=A0A1G2QLD1_9BACT|nr:MAG: hypothetical protein UY66_C0010G0010 [Parcubacteria group bacterium GW2011_GWC1_51_35]KKW34050.1 MAG: hypothetical protein UY80_C0025G0005 [Parcubacteria group bacterium GW2011_GWB1_53_43]OHA61336.1 MAG: hypothetical protein A2569_00590 [Candidatus Vogelbacteria bacterium RIFOXYD1_FULL_51_18]HBB65295.1 hypothetical protein [Candidatus Vogelbacteria bacterium]HBC44222.1 hypothetical protein [Candidatus Vogelbacteria bacterium]